MDEILKYVAYAVGIGGGLGGVIYAIKSINPMKKSIEKNHTNHDKRIVELEKDSASYKTSLTHFTVSINQLNDTLKDNQKTNLDMYKLMFEKLK
jgi:threonine dehydratase